MSSSLSSTGCRKPRIALEPEYNQTYGDLAVELVSGYGQSPYDWQRDILNVWLGVDKDGKFTSRRCGIDVARQNGKNDVILFRELFGMVFLGEHFLHTAHEVKTARKAFVRLLCFFDNRDKFEQLNDLVKDIRRTNGQEAIFLKNGGSVEFIARSRGSGRGFTVDVIVLDEAQELTDEQFEALLPAISASKNSQTIFAGTPPKETMPAEVFTRIREDGLKGESKTLSWHEWSVENIGDVSDKSRWHETNPSLGLHLNIETIEEELAQMSQDGFARERLCWWPKRVGTKLINKDEWNSLATDDPPLDGTQCFGVKFSSNGKKVSVVVSLKHGDGIYVEMIHDRSTTHGTRWLVDWIRMRRDGFACVFIDGRSGADAFKEALYARDGYKGNQLKKGQAVVVTPRQASAAASMLLGSITDKSLSHFGQPALTESAVNAIKRKIGNDGAFGFGANEIDSTPVEAASLAVLAANTTKKKQGRKQRLQ